MVLLRLSFLKALEGELLALRWNDVDLERRIVKVRGSMHRTADGLVILESKTAKSRRQLQITRGAAESLRRHRLKQAEDRLMLGAVWEDNDLGLRERHRQTYGGWQPTAALVQAAS